MMSATDVAALEQSLAALIAAERKRHAAELEPLRKRIDALERDLAAEVEARAGAGGKVTRLAARGGGR